MCSSDLLVTHDPEEAAFLSDELMVIANGQVLQSGTSRSVFSRPASVEVAKLLGVENLNLARVATSSSLDIDGTLIDIGLTDIAPGTSVLWSIRPERVLVSTDLGGDGVSNEGARVVLRGTLSDVADVGTAYDLFLSVGDGLEIHARTWGSLDVDVGSRCRVELDPEAISLWVAPATPSN